MGVYWDEELFLGDAAEAAVTARERLEQRDYSGAAAHAAVARALVDVVREKRAQAEKREAHDLLFGTEKEQVTRPVLADVAEDEDAPAKSKTKGAK